MFSDSQNLSGWHYKACSNFLKIDKRYCDCSLKMKLVSGVQRK